MSEPPGELRNPYTNVEQQAQNWPRSLLTRPGDNKRVCRSIAFACLCVVPTQLWLQKHHVFFYLPLTPCRTVSRSTQISAALHVHVAGLHMAHSQIYYFQYRVILPSDHAMDDNQCEPRQGEGGNCSHVSGREALKHCFCFWVFLSPRSPQTRSKSASAAFGLEPWDAFQIGKTSPITASGCYTDPRRSTIRFEQKEAAVREGAKPNATSSLRSCLH